MKDLDISRFQSHQWQKEAKISERVLGELIPEQIERGGDRKTESRLQDATLKKLGIEKTQSHRWQAVAKMPG